MINTITLGAGCFWGVQAAFNLLRGVQSTEVGYCGGQTENPTYEQVCSKMSGHIEVVKITYNSEEISLSEILELFMEIHDPTQRDGQGNDIGPQYLSALFFNNTDEKNLIDQQLSLYQKNVESQIVTQVRQMTTFFPAEDYHQLYLDKNPGGYCHIDILRVKEFLDSRGLGIK